jgi:predicted dinucleotide-binding enzyme
MVTVAIAGGTGKIGLTIAEVLKENLKHKVIVLSRKVCISVLLAQDQCPPPRKPSCGSPEAITGRRNP